MIGARSPVAPVTVGLVASYWRLSVEFERLPATSTQPPVTPALALSGPE